MHLALRRYVDPARDLFQYFGLGVAVVAIALAAIDERLDDVDDQEAIAAEVSQANHNRRVATACPGDVSTR